MRPIFLSLVVKALGVKPVSERGGIGITIFYIGIRSKLKPGNLFDLPPGVLNLLEEARGPRGRGEFFPH